MTRQTGPPAQPVWPTIEPASLPVGDEPTVAVWAFSLDRPPLPLSALDGHLAEDEKARAARFHFDIHRRRFIAGRGVLREVLGRLLQRSPRSLVFRYGAKGKPALVRDFGGRSDRRLPDLRFNLSHSEDLALLALSWGQEVGVDVEAVRPMEDGVAIAERFFAPREAKDFVALPEPDRDSGFFRCWTRKEAYVKARGDGLSLPTTDFEVDFSASNPAERVVRFPAEPAEEERWHLIGLDPAKGFSGALAVERVADTAPPRLFLASW